jgi:uncharacterized metal-binding protein YceD (DUF177 family)
MEEVLPPDFLDIHDEELAFNEPVHVGGEAYLADDHLVIHLSIKTTAQMPCAICNNTVLLPIAIKDLYLTHPLDEIKNPIYDLSEEVRENILLQAPLFAECNLGKCPERENVKKFMKSGDPSKKSEEMSQFPFADL